MKKLLILVLVSIFLASCASLEGLEEGRTIGEGNSEIGVTINYTSIPDLQEANSPIIGYPSLVANYKYGIGQKLDISATISSTLYIGFGAKYQFLGDQETKFNMAAGLNVGSALGAINQVTVPLYLSYHPSEKISINLSPKYFVMFSTIDDASTNSSFLGTNFGFLFGDRHKFGIDFGLFSPISATDDISTPILNFAIGGKFSLSK